MRLIVLSAAQEQLAGAAEFYGRRRMGLGAAFLAEVRRAYTQLRREPLIGSPIEQGERKYVLQGLMTIVILTVAHHSREYGFWRRS